MKSLKVTLIAALAVTISALQPATAQEENSAVPAAISAGKETDGKEKPKEALWPELKTFHQVMAQTFHPAEEGDFKPITERSGELHEKAQLLASSKVPKEFNTPEILKATKELTYKTKDVNDKVKSNASNDEIFTALNSAHDSFHKIVGLCKKDAHGHEGHKH